MIKQRYKITEISEMPEDWEVVKFENCIIRKRITIGKVKQQQYKQVGRYPIVDQGQKLIAGYWNEETEVYKGELPVIIFGDHTRIIKFVDFPFVAGADGTKILLPNSEKIYSLFFYYALLTLKIPSRGYNRHYSLLKENKIPLPPLPIQQKIAAVLSTVQTAKKKTEAVINAAKELKKSLMKHLFTYGPVPLGKAENAPLKETEIGMVPEEWEVVKLRDYIVRTEQKDMRKTSAEFNYIDVSGIDRDDLRIISTTKYKSKNAPSRARKLVKEHDVIIATVRPTLRRIALIPKIYNNQICSTAFCVLRGNTNLDNFYIYYTVQRNSFIDSLGKIQRGASYPAVTDSDVKSQKIPLPALPTQQKIASILSAINQKIQAEENEKKALEDLFKSLLHNLMTAKIRVNHLEV